MAATCDTCGCKVDTLGIEWTEFGSYCGLCESQYVQHRSTNNQAVKLGLITSKRHATESILWVIRDGLIVQKIMDMLVGPNELVRPKYAKRLKIVNLRRILIGRFPNRPGRPKIFGLLIRAWTPTTEDSEQTQDCLDKVIDFVIPLGDSLATWKWSSLQYAERT